MKCFCGIVIALLAVGVVCQANPVKREATNQETIENEIEREKRQMKGSSATAIGAEQAEAKFLNSPLLSPLATATTGALQAITTNLQTGRQNGLTLQGAFLPNLGFGINGGLTGMGGIGAIPPPINPNGGIGTTLTSYPSGFEMYPQYMFNNGFYPNVGGPFGPLENAVNLANLQGINTQLVTQPSPIQQPITPFPLVGNFYPQLGYSPAYQNFQG